MSRYASSDDWELVGESSDPVPGDPEEMARLGRELRAIADSIARQSREIERVNDAESWDGKAAKEFRNQSGDTADRLMKAYARYDAAADALGTTVNDLGLDACHTTYASELNRAQMIADKALRDAREAKGELDTVTTAISCLPDDVEDDDPELVGLENDQETATASLASCTSEITRAKEVRNDAVSQLVSAIEEIIDDKKYKDSFWDRISGAVSMIAKVAGLVAMVAGLIALGVGWIPVFGQALAAAFGAVALAFGVLSLLANTVLAASGHGDWSTVALDAIGVATFGIGRAAMAGVRAANTGLRAMGRTGVARQTGSYSRANRLTDSPRRAAHRQAVDSMPQRPVTPHLKEGFSPKQMYTDTKEAVRNFRGGGGGPWPRAINELDPEISRLADGLRRLDPLVVQQPGVAEGVRVFQQNASVWIGANAYGVTAAGVSNHSTTAEISGWVADRLK